MEFEHFPAEEQWNSRPSSPTGLITCKREIILFNLEDMNGLCGYFWKKKTTEGLQKLKPKVTVRDHLLRFLCVTSLTQTLSAEPKDCSEAEYFNLVKLSCQKKRTSRATGRGGIHHDPPQMNMVDHMLQVRWKPFRSLPA